MNRKLFFIWSYSIAIILLVSTSLLLEFGWATKIALYYFMGLFGLLIAELSIGDRLRIILWGRKISSKRWFIEGLIINYTIPGLVLFLSKQPTNSLFGQIVILSIMSINGLVIYFFLYKKSRRSVKLQ